MKKARNFFPFVFLLLFQGRSELDRRGGGMRSLQMLQMLCMCRGWWLRNLAMKIDEETMNKLDEA